MTERWTSLRDATTFIESKDDGRLRYVFGDTEATIAKALQSREVPMRGKPPGDWALERIDVLITRDTKVECAGGNITIGWNKYEDIDIDIEVLEKYMLANLVPPGIQIWSEPQRSRPTGNAETEIRKFLRRQPNEPIMTKKQLRAEIDSGCHELSKVCGNNSLSARALARAWTEEAPENWRNPGRRRGT
jgi:hypothetical protein